MLREIEDMMGAPAPSDPGIASRCILAVAACVSRCCHANVSSHKNKRMAMRSFGLTLLLLLAAGPPVPANADPVLTEATELAGFVMFTDSGAPGMVLAVVRGTDSLVLGFGETAKGNGHAPDGTSLVRINSITKVFATEMLVALAAEGKLRLTDPLQRFAGDATVPVVGPRPITLLDLATHSAGLPREVEGAPPDAAPRTWPPRAQRWKWLQTNRPLWAPGTVASYSNVGFDLLADAVETAGGQPYPDLLRTHVTAPLGMVDTVFAPSSEQCARLMVASGFGGTGPCVDTTATDGSGGLYSTANDMVRWLRHNMQDPAGTLALSHAVYRQRQSIPAAIGFDESGPMAGLGLGWVIVAADGIRPLLVQKSGAGVGFMTYLASAPGRDVGLFVAVNRLDFAAYSALVAAANGLIATLVTR
jgi:serine-type D-Ala-D-Ala carboxypeptidase/endopeptidase